VADDGVLAPAEVIVVTTAAGGAGVLEAADLVHAGVARRVAFFTGPSDEADRELLRRGVSFEDDGARSARELRALGVTAVEEIARPVTGSEDEGRVLPLWCDQRHLAAVVVVTTSDHSRRLRRVLRRAMGGHATRVAVRPARYSEFDPERWWLSRGGTRTGVIEMQKLLLDVALHPLS